MKRLFIEAQSEDKDKIQTCALLCSFAKKEGGRKDFFDTVMSNAMDYHEETFKLIKEHDEIYCSTRLIPMGGAYGSGILMNNLMYKAIKNNITGKSLYIMGKLSNIMWGELNKKLFQQCFKVNKLFILDKEGEEFIEAPYKEILEKI